MMVFRLLFLLILITLHPSCKESNKKEMPNSDVEQRRLFEIKSVRKIIPDKKPDSYDKPNEPFFEIILKNVSSYDLDIYYRKEPYIQGYPQLAPSCIEYVNYPSTAGCSFLVDTSYLIKKNEEFLVYVPIWMSNSMFYAYEFQGITFKLLISSPADLSDYFKEKPDKPWFWKCSIPNSQDGYKYPLEFTYWTPCDIFWEHDILGEYNNYYLLHQSNN